MYQTPLSDKLVIKPLTAEEMLKEYCEQQEKKKKGKGYSDVIEDSVR
jgi:hypothetical protein